MPGYQSEEFEAFMGIPFAQPPVGPLRLKNPVPANSWEGVLDAGAAKDSCLQRNYFTKDWDFMGVEDCLYLNVYRPKQKDENLLPVMFYIHSGGFFSGSAHPVASGPEFLMDTGKVVMVTVSYRLGPLGFLSTGDENMPGNFGFKDQRLAMQWVQKHIAKFGGDPQMVTILGHSAGGISAHMHMLSPNSKGLFQRAMSLTGTMFVPAMSILKDPLSQARHLAKEVGIDQAETLSSQDLAEAIRNACPKKLLLSVDSLKAWDNMPLISTLPVLESPSPDAFMVEDPLKAHLAGRINQVPWVVGINSRAGEGALSLLRPFSNPQRMADFNKKFLEHMSLMLNLPEGTSPQMVKEILDAYEFQGESLNNDTILTLAEICGDFNFYFPIYETISSYANYANLEENPLFIYIFEFSGMHSMSLVFSGSTEDFGVGAAHMDDGIHTIRLPVLFGDYPKDSEDAKVVQRMTSLVTDFVKTGIFNEGSTCKAADFKDLGMCSYLHFGGTTDKYQEKVQRSLKLTAFPIWKKLFIWSTISESENRDVLWEDENESKGSKDPRFEVAWNTSQSGQRKVFFTIKVNAPSRNSSDRFGPLSRKVLRETVFYLPPVTALCFQSLCGPPAMIQLRTLLLLLLLPFGQLFAGPKPLNAALATGLPSMDQLTVCPPSVGCLKGTYRQGYQSERFEAFMGIPYALPPVGDLRFKNPKVMPKLLGVYDASQPKMDCIQKNYLLPSPIIYGVEDCLYLNVYRPEVRKSILPVMVYIHGGGFFGGSAGPGLTGPEYFMDTGEVILVTMAYRLGPFGFLSTQDALMPGNFGLKDQNLALRWVQRNIGYFGGDPQSVTIFGQSAGGVAAHMHLLSPRSQGLFHRVISMSGTANVPFAIAEEPLEQARLLAEFAQIPDAQTLSTVKLAKALRRVDAIKLLNAGDGLKFWDVDHMTNFRPVIEKGLEGKAFLSKHPKDILADGERASIPLLLGTVPGEGAVRVVNILGNETLRQSFNSRFDELLQELMEFPPSFSQERLKKSMEFLVGEYFHGQHEVNEETVQGFMDLISDRGFKQPLYHTIRKDVCHTPNPVYLYSFNYRGPLSYASVYTSADVIGKYGVVHCDDLLYLFRSPLIFPDFERNSTEAKVIKSFVDYFVHFAKYGKPRNAESLNPCSIEVLQSRPNGICDYQEFANAPDPSKGFEIGVASKFQTSRVKIWSLILNENSNES
ncbi:uncharacterized protein LOC108112087 [Drosophila eugracilis]|uniref:uncharacterized protein LOC108112087 n=1 Tax=Drosophila eugracilis TaxID=29029 RepID=UPI0007E5CC6A|nr:uncharacterized protein LOC108112087 [Drosophila eugracilis]